MFLRRRALLQFRRPPLVDELVRSHATTYGHDGLSGPLAQAVSKSVASRCTLWISTGQLGKIGQRDLRKMLVGISRYLRRPTDDFLDSLLQKARLVLRQRIADTTRFPSGCSAAPVCSEVSNPAENVFIDCIFRAAALRLSLRCFSSIDKQK